MDLMKKYVDIEWNTGQFCAEGCQTYYFFNRSIQYYNKQMCYPVCCRNLINYKKGLYFNLYTLFQFLISNSAIQISPLWASSGGYNTLLLKMQCQIRSVIVFVKCFVYLKMSLGVKSGSWKY